MNRGLHLSRLLIDEMGKDAAVALKDQMRITADQETGRSHRWVQMAARDVWTLEPIGSKDAAADAAIKALG